MLRPLAFYLPQFHPTAENDEWWGPGFTEWTNVAKARPRFRGHDQPRLPRDMGFYDLRLAEARRAQAAMADDAGVAGFVLYHYWFNGRRVLDAPLEGILKDTEYTFPFCLSWANENWTRRWDGGGDHLLLEQSYSAEDDLAHITWLLTVMKDERYIKHEGKPVLLVHRAALIPEPRRMTETWRREARRAGFPDLYLLRTEHFSDEAGDPTGLGFDAAVDFQPNFAALPQATRVQTWIDRVRPLQIRRHDRILDYGDVVRAMRAREDVAYTRWPGVFPGWDNSPRRSREALIIKNPDAEAFESWVRSAAEAATAIGQSSYLFLNAWNEWAEGAVLEPDLIHGRAFLDALSRGLSR